jgi:flagellar biosynthesis protein FlhB
MADNETGRTEQPTAKRLEDARKEGQVPRSPELSAAAVVFVAGGGLQLLGGYVAGQLSGIMRTGLALSREQALDESLAGAAFSSSMLHALLACMPTLGLTTFAALAAPLVLGGWNLSIQALVPDFTRLDPRAGFSRMFSARGAVELAKAFAKFLAIGAVATCLLWQKSGELMSLGSEPGRLGFAHAAALTGHGLILLAGALGLIAAIDVPWQLWQHSRKLRMTREEVRQEARERDGAPEIKGRIRKTQAAIARGRMMHEVPKADVVVANPTHYAVALRYDERRMRAPVVIAKGADAIATRIREVATEHRVPIFEAPPLARILYRNVEIGREIPVSLYSAVAQVLTYIYQLKTARRDGTTPPAPPALDASIESTRH